MIVFGSPIETPLRAQIEAALTSYRTFGKNLVDAMRTASLPNTIRPPSVTVQRFVLSDPKGWTDLVVEVRKNKDERVRYTVTNGAYGEDEVTWLGLGALGIPGASPGLPDQFATPVNGKPQLISARIGAFPEESLKTRIVELSKSSVGNNLDIQYSEEPQRWNHIRFDPMLVAGLLAATQGPMRLQRLGGNFSLIVNDPKGMGLVLGQRW